MDESLSLKLWRAVGGHDELQPALAAALAAVHEDLSVDGAAIRLLVAEHRLWETVAAAGARVAGSMGGVDRIADEKEPGPPEELRQGRVLAVDAAAFARSHPGIVPHAARGALVLVAIADEPRLSAVLLLSGLPGTALGARQRDAAVSYTHLTLPTN